MDVPSAADITEQACSPKGNGQYRYRLGDRRLVRNGGGGRPARTVPEIDVIEVFGNVEIAGQPAQGKNDRMLYERGLPRHRPIALVGIIVKIVNTGQAGL